jgi:hypothetical protein
LLLVRYENDLGHSGFRAADWLASWLKEITTARVIILPPGFAVDHMTKEEFARLE